MIEKIQKMLSKNGSSERRTFLKLAGLSSLVTVLPTFKTKSAHARYIFNRNWWYNRDVFSTEQNEFVDSEYCIQHNLKLFEPGAQGEHKIARGFLPQKTWSSHWIAHPQFSKAIQDFLQREALAMEDYGAELMTSSPFKEQ